MAVDAAAMARAVAAEALVAAATIVMSAQLAATTAPLPAVAVEATALPVVTIATTVPLAAMTAPLPAVAVEAGLYFEVLTSPLRRPSLPRRRVIPTARSACRKRNGFRSGRNGSGFLEGTTSPF